MKIIVLPKELQNQVNTDSIKGIPNYLPSDTVRYNIDKKIHIESILGEISKYIVDRSTITENDPKEAP
jgi:hypothetical protein